MESTIAPKTSNTAKREVQPFISVILPVRNEEGSISGIIKSLLDQDYPPRRFEIIVVDGESEDNTKQVVENLSRDNPQIRLFDNPKRLSSAGKNIGVRNSQGEIILFVDGHCHLANVDLLREVARLHLQDKRRVLCRPQPLDFPGNSLFQRAVAACRATLWGHGLDSTIYSDKEGEVNPTSSGAAYPREVFDEIGHIDESFDACEDVEFNLRCHLAGYKGFESPKLKVYYQPRRNLSQLFRQMYRYGLGRFRFLIKHPEGFSLAQVIPALLVFLLPVTLLAILLGPLFMKAVLVIWGLYLLITLTFSTSVASQREPVFLFLSPPIFFAIHFGLGCGFWAGVWGTCFGEGGKRPTPAENRGGEESSKIKTMFIIDSLPNRRAGTEKALSSLIENLDREKFEPILCCLQGNDNLRFRECRSLDLEVDSFGSFKAIRKLLYLATFLKRGKVDLLVTFFKNANYFGTLAAKLSGTPKIISNRRNLGYWQRWRDLLLLRTINSWTDLVIANSEAVKEAVIKKEGIRSEKIRVVYNGIDIGEFIGKLIPKEEAKSSLRISPEVPIVGTVSNLRPVKRLDLFLEAAQIVSQKFPKTKFLIVGEGPQRRDLESLVGRFRLEDRVVFTGEAEEVASYLSAFDIAVLSSSSEGFSNALLEYSLSALPVVATTAGGNPEIISDGENGYLVPPGEAKPLAQRIITLLADEGLRRRLGENGRQKVLEHFTMKRMVAELERCFLQVCGGERTRTIVGDTDLEANTTYPREEESKVVW